jgi:hypothetical protein
MVLVLALLLAVQAVLVAVVKKVLRLVLALLDKVSRVALVYQAHLILVEAVVVLALLD